MRRNILPVFSLICILGVMAFAAWLTWNPDAELVRRAEEWPLVGPWATRFRERYLPPLPPPQASAAESWEIRRLGPPDAAAGEDRRQDGRPRDRRIESADVVWVLPGAALRREPSATAELIEEFDAVATVGKIERRGDWFHVRHSGSQGWVYLEGYDERGGPPYGETPEPPQALPPRPPDAATLALARELLGEREHVRRFGPYTAYTDFEDAELFAHLDGLAAQIEDLYRDRYGLAPLGTPAAAVVLYRSELAYRVLEKRSPVLADLHSAGHASRGIAVLYAGHSGRGEIGTTLTHELVHFLNRRALGPALPPWIDEGLADGLATARVGADGRIEPRALGGERREADGRMRIDGALATLYRLRGAIADGSLPPLLELTRLDWDAFVRSGRRQLYYGTSAFWIRYLLDGGDPALGDGLRRFLAGVAAGEPATPEALRDLLGRDWTALDAGFRQWLSSHPDLPSEAPPGGTG
jgi:Bacterial SH3 domain